MKTTKLILTGGFLGAGKTTLLWEVASRLISKGKRVGLITNDQAPDLVDTALLSHNNVKVNEVSNSCFCCNYNGLISALKQVRDDADADIIIAEPVGSCTDLSATIIQPLKEYMRNELVLSPLTVLADPFKISEIIDGKNAGYHPGAAYIFRKQLEESDIILLSKSDLLTSGELDQLQKKIKLKYPEADIMAISAITGEGVEEWLNEVMIRTDTGNRLANVDYDIYAEGEAVLGWFNGNFELSGKDINWDEFAEQFLNVLSVQFDSKNASVGHVKLILETSGGYKTGNLTGNKNTLNFKGSAGNENSAKMILNARVEMTPLQLEKIVLEKIESVTGSKITYKILSMRCFSPGRPNPTYRFDRIV